MISSKGTLCRPGSMSGTLPRSICSIAWIAGPEVGSADSSATAAVGASSTVALSVGVAAGPDVAAGPSISGGAVGVQAANNRASKPSSHSSIGLIGASYPKRPAGDGSDLTVGRNYDRSQD
jgi:hypothetical protein